MKRLLALLLALLLVVALAVSACVTQVAPQAAPADDGSAAAAGPDDLLAAIMARGTIRISTDPNYAPQSFLDESGNFQGFDVNVAQEIAKRLGVEVEFVTPDWDLITAGNWGDQWDMSVGSMTVTTRRQEILEFASPPYYYTPAQFAAVDGSGVETLEDLNGKTICVGVSTTYESWLMGDMEGLGLPAASFYVEAAPTDILIIPLTVDNDCAQQIQAGRHEFEAFLTSNTVVEAAIGAGVPVHKVGTPVFSENLAVAFDRSASKEIQRLVEKVSGIVADMHADGTLSSLSVEWFGEDLTMDPTQ